MKSKTVFNHFDLTQGDNHMTNIIKKVAVDIAEATETTILAQLNEFIKRGLIVVEEIQPLLVSCFEVHENSPSYQVRIEKGVQLLLKDQEYIESLESNIELLKQETEELKQKLEKITNIVDNALKNV